MRWRRPRVRGPYDQWVRVVLDGGWEFRCPSCMAQYKLHQAGDCLAGKCCRGPWARPGPIGIRAMGCGGRTWGQLLLATWPLAAEENFIEGIMHMVAGEACSRTNNRDFLD
eukprot:1901134-Prorocentrum_lima.AAC.1